MHPAQSRRLRVERLEKAGDIEGLRAMQATAIQHCGPAHQREVARAIGRLQVRPHRACRSCGGDLPNYKTEGELCLDCLNRI